MEYTKRLFTMIPSKILYHSNAKDHFSIRGTNIDFEKSINIKIWSGTGLWCGH